MLARMFQAKHRVRDKRIQAHLIEYCLHKWQPKAHVFLSFKSYMSKVRYLQAWWRRMSKALREVRERISKRWEKIERYGTSGFLPTSPGIVHAEIVDPAKRM